jgi:tetratricopeptide (TPR) repeat protein
VKLDLRDHLEKKNYPELNKILADFQEASQQDIYQEKQLFTAYDAFEIEDPDYEPLFNSWVETYSDHYQPYLARANYFYTMAWHARGGKWASETKQEQFDRMKTYFEKAATDIKTTLEINSQSLVAYKLLIGILGSQQGADRLMRGVLDQAVSFQPATYNVRLNYLHFLSPRWGGSFEQMQSFVNESLQYVDQNPKLNLLEGRIYAEAAFSQYLNDKYSVAEELYTKAISYGDRPYNYLSRGKTRYKRENYQGALEDLNRAIDLDSEDAEHYYWRSKIYSKLEKYDDAASDIAIAGLLAPWDEKIQSRKDWLVSKLIRLGYELNRARKHEAAIEKFNAALSLDPTHADAYNRKAGALIKLNELDEALPHAKLAVEYDPDNFAFYQKLDWILAQRKDWDQVISYWSQYIDLHPDDGAAYVERGGAFYHKGDLRSAVADAKIAADLGNPQGKEAYNRFKHLVD